MKVKFKWSFGVIAILLANLSGCGLWDGLDDDASSEDKNKPAASSDQPMKYERQGRRPTSNYMSQGPGPQSRQAQKIPVM